MNCVVQKYGGSSLASVDHIRRVARQVVEKKRQGYSVAVVVSAMASETDRLLGLTQALSPSPDGAEADVATATGEILAAALTSLAIQAEGEKARSLLAHQLPILTDSHSQEARILSVGNQAIRECFHRSEIPVIAGFQGVDAKGRITTLGRGGSDTTAVAVAASLGAVPCEIYTDVPGIFSADPRLCPEARKWDRVSYSFMIEAAALGAKVMHDRSVRMGQRYQVPIRVLSSFEDSSGTAIVEEDVPAWCISADRNISRLHLFSSRAASGLTESLLENEITPRMVTQVSRERTLLVLRRSDLGKATSLLQKEAVFVEADLAQVSVIGNGVFCDPTQWRRFIRSLESQGIGWNGIHSSDWSLSAFLECRDVEKACRALHREFVGKGRE